MQSTNTPAKVLTAFADQDSSKAELPNTTSDSGRASQTQGFPPITGMPPEAGGVPPQLPDMNGAINQAGRPGWWTQLGGRYAYDGTFASNSAINGYPRGAMLMSADFTGEWLSTAEANTANPDSTGAGWVPGYHYGATTLANQAGGTVVLTPAQAAKTTLFINGTLTSNLIIEVPAWIREWTVYNGTGGAFTVSIRTPGRPAVVVPQASIPSVVRGNGADVAVATLDVPLASTTVAGRTPYANATDTINGARQDAAVTPFGLAQAVPGMVPVATATVQGKVRLTNPGEGVANDNTIALTPGAAAAAYARINGPFVNNAGTAILAGAASVSLRPNGAESEVGRVFISSTGEVVAAGVIRSEASIFYGGSTVRLATTGTGGSVSLRPNGGNSTVGEFFVLSTGNASCAGSLSAAGGFDTPSSRDIKNDLGPFPYGLDDVLSLKPIRYAYKDDESQRPRLGFYLEDVRAVAPEVAGDTALQEQQIIPMLVAAVHELLARIESLEGR